MTPSCSALIASLVETFGGRRPALLRRALERVAGSGVPFEGRYMMLRGVALAHKRAWGAS